VTDHDAPATTPIATHAIHDNVDTASPGKVEVTKHHEPEDSNGKERQTVSRSSSKRTLPEFMSQQASEGRSA
jgi:hypothetical protein